MKELSVEQKAKAYDEAKLRMSAAYNSNRCTIGFMNEIFPELKESEEDRIRKELKEFLDICLNARPQIIEEPQYLKFTNWLEKQGEQNPDNKVEPKFKVGDWIIYNKNIELANSLMLVTGKDDNEYLCNYRDGQCSYNIEFIDKEYRLWTIQDAKDGDVLYSLDSNQPFIYKSRKAYEQAIAYCGINKYGNFFVWDTKDCIITLDKYIPATNEQRELLFQKMHEAGYEWDAENKKLKKEEVDNLHGYLYGEQKPADNEMIEILRTEYEKEWSKEDEEMLNSVLSCIEQCHTQAVEATYNGNRNVDPKRYERIKNWLKSFKGRVQPQPKQEILEKLEEWLDAYVSGLADVDTASLICSFTNYLDGKLPKSLSPQNKWKPSDEQMDNK